MGETIRDYLKRRQRWNGAIWLAGFALWLAPGTFNQHGAASTWLRLAGLLVVAGGFVLMGNVKCPQCAKQLGRFFGRQRGSADFCPHCGVSLDQLHHYRNPESEFVASTVEAGEFLLYVHEVVWSDPGLRLPVSLEIDIARLPLKAQRSSAGCTAGSRDALSCRAARIPN